MLSSFWVASTKPEPALVRRQGREPWQGRGGALAPRDRGPGAGVYCWMGALPPGIARYASPSDHHDSQCVHCGLIEQIAEIDNVLRPQAVEPTDDDEVLDLPRESLGVDETEQGRAVDDHVLVIALLDLLEKVADRIARQELARVLRSCTAGKDSELGRSVGAKLRTNRRRFDQVGGRPTLLVAGHREDLRDTRCLLHVEQLVQSGPTEVGRYKQCLLPRPGQRLADARRHLRLSLAVESARDQHDVLLRWRQAEP